MHSATRLDDLKILECFLQNALHAHLGRIVPFRVQCLYKDDTLWVLAQHPADVTIDIPDTFGVLERTLQAEEPKTPLVVKMYLRAEGSQKPYSQHGFTVYPLVKKAVPGEAAPAMTGMREDRQALERDRNELVPGQPLHIQDDSMDNSDITPSTVSEIILLLPISSTPLVRPKITIFILPILPPRRNAKISCCPFSAVWACWRSDRERDIWGLVPACFLPVRS
jgi:hypothetical protein